MPNRLKNFKKDTKDYVGNPIEGKNKYVTLLLAVFLLLVFASVPGNVVSDFWANQFGRLPFDLPDADLPDLPDLPDLNPPDPPEFGPEADGDPDTNQPIALDDFTFTDNGNGTMTVFVSLYYAGWTQQQCWDKDYYPYWEWLSVFLGHTHNLTTPAAVYFWINFFNVDPPEPTRYTEYCTMNGDPGQIHIDFWDYDWATPPTTPDYAYYDWLAGAEVDAYVAVMQPGHFTFEFLWPITVWQGPGHYVMGHLIQTPWLTAPGDATIPSIMYGDWEYRQYV